MTYTVSSGTLNSTILYYTVFCNVRYSRHLADELFSREMSYLFNMLSSETCQH